MTIATVLGMMLVGAKPVPDWENEQVTGINKEEARVFSLPFANQEEALEKDWRDSSRVMSLNGDWSFHFAKNPEERAEGFFKTDFDANSLVIGQT